MKNSHFLLIFSIIVLSVVSCQYNSKETSNRISDEVAPTEGIDIFEIIKNKRNIESLVGNFNGKDLDILFSKPLKNNIEGICNKWRIFTKNGTVKELTIDEPTVDIQFIREGDTDNNGTEEWGYLAQPENSIWNVYHLYAYHKGEWVEMIEPLLIYLPNFTEEENKYSVDDIIQKSDTTGYVKAKYSKLDENGLDFSVVDTLIKINPILLKD